MENGKITDLFKIAYLNETEKERLEKIKNDPSRTDELRLCKRNVKLLELKIENCKGYEKTTINFENLTAKSEFTHGDTKIFMKLLRYALYGKINLNHDIILNNSELAKIELIVKSNDKTFKIVRKIKLHNEKLLHKFEYYILSNDVIFVDVDLGKEIIFLLKHTDEHEHKLIEISHTNYKNDYIVLGQVGLQQKTLQFTKDTNQLLHVSTFDDLFVNHYFGCDYVANATSILCDGNVEYKSFVEMSDRERDDLMNVSLRVIDACKLITEITKNDGTIYDSLEYYHMNTMKNVTLNANMILKEIPTNDKTIILKWSKNGIALEVTTNENVKIPISDLSEHEKKCINLCICVALSKINTYVVNDYFIFCKNKNDTFDYTEHLNAIKDNFKWFYVITYDEI